MQDAMVTQPSREPEHQVFPDREVPWGIKEVLLGAAWFLVVFLVIPLFLVLPFYAAYGEESTEAYAATLIVGMGTEVAFVIIAWAYTVRVHPGGWRLLGIKPPTWSTLGWAAVAVIAAFALTAIYSGIIELFDIDALRSERDDQIPNAILDNTRLAIILTIVVIAFAPICEEILFRGFLFPGIARRFGVTAGILLSSLIFSSAHISPKMYRTLVPISVVAVAFAFSYWRSGNILSSMGAHLVFNTFSIIITLSSDS